jgi:arylformamidase
MIDRPSRPPIIDITRPMDPSAVPFPGDPPLEITREASCQRDGYLLHRMSMGLHFGTHVDAPAHFLTGGATIDQLAPDRFVVPAQVVSAQGGGAISADDLPDRSQGAGEALLLATGSFPPGADPAGGWSALTPQACGHILSAGWSLVGIDTPSVDAPDSADHECHHQLLAGDVVVLESADLRRVAPGRYSLICLPLRLVGCEASPVRAVLVADGPGP